MEIRDPVHGTISLSPQEIEIVDSPEFQRLRSIKQLGFAEFSFPGATHNRYIHSIGVFHLAGVIFDSLFADFAFWNAEERERLKNTFRMAALLHDIGHGPLSHTTEEVMPALKDLEVAAYQYAHRKSCKLEGARATHEDYTIKMITDSPLSERLARVFPNIHPLAIAGLIDSNLMHPFEDQYKSGGFDFRPILSQLVSSELDCDRMDYLVRDSYFCGTSYGRVELGWLINNLRYHEVDGRLFLALNRRALYTFDDFLISRHHMHLMVYFHHKAIIYEEMLGKYLTSADCEYVLPSKIQDYLACTDASLYEHLRGSKNPWAQRISTRRPFKVLVEIHSTKSSPRAELMVERLKTENIETIFASSQARLSKYHNTTPEASDYKLYVVDDYDKWDQPVPIEECTEIFKKYEENRIIDRLYVDPVDFPRARAVLAAAKL